MLFPRLSLSARCSQRNSLDSRFLFLSRSYQPYFSATAANVLFPSWSHDIEGDWADQEMYTRWLQAGSFSGTMRSHERGMSAGGCGNEPKVTPTSWGPTSGSCSLIAPWNVGPKFMEANRRALQSREKLLPYIYTAHRALFDVGVGILQPLYFQHPKAEQAYRMNATHNAQYYFGPDILVAPITAPAGEANGDPSQTLAIKTSWLPQGTWFDALTGKITTVATEAGVLFTRGYTLGEIPMWFKAGSIIPYLPLKSLPTMVGVAIKQYGFLGFRIIPGANSTTSTTAVYEDDGSSTAYLTSDAFVWTHCNVSTDATTKSTSVSIVSLPAGGKTGYAKFPRVRSYQLRLPNGLPPAKVSLTIGGASLDVPFVRYGAVASSRKTPDTHQWYYSFAEDEGLGPVIDIVNVPTTEIISITIEANPNTAAAAPAMAAGLFGTLMRGIDAHANQDIDRSNPDSNSPGPAFLSQLSSIGIHLEKLADPATAAKMAFTEVIATVPALVANTTKELKEKFAKGNGRVNYTLALLL